MKRIFTLLLWLAIGLLLTGARDRIEIPLADSPVLGPADAPVTMIEFIDFQ